MIRHLFLMIWNQKSRNLGLLLEIFFSFMVLFAVLTFIINNYNFYRQSIGFNYDNIWVINQETQGAEKEEIIATRELIQDQLSAYPEVAEAAFSKYNIPYGNSMSNTSIELTDKGYEDGEKGVDYVVADIFRVSENFANTMDLEIIEGRWFTEEDRLPDVYNIVINQDFKQAVFGDEPAVGKTLEGYADDNRKIIGVIGNYKYQGEFVGSKPGFFAAADSTLGGVALLKVKQGTGAAFEAKLLKDLNRLASNWSFEIDYMDQMRTRKLRETKLPMIIFLIVSGFLVFNVALGLFGILWYNINKRKQEIGIRRAMGATKSGISLQFVGEVLVLTTLGIAIGTFFAVQFPLLQVFNIQLGVYLLSILSAILIIYTLVFICSLYPSQQAAQLQPAIALHAE